MQIMTFCLHVLHFLGHKAIVTTKEIFVNVVIISEQQSEKLEMNFSKSLKSRRHFNDILMVKYVVCLPIVQLIIH